MVIRQSDEDGTEFLNISRCHVGSLEDVLYRNDDSICHQPLKPGPYPYSKGQAVSFFEMTLTSIGQSMPIFGSS